MLCIEKRKKRTNRFKMLVENVINFDYFESGLRDRIEFIYIDFSSFLLFAALYRTIVKIIYKKYVQYQS